MEDKEMNNRLMLRRALVLSVGLGLAASAGMSAAMDFGNMMNPSKWMGGGKDRDRGDYGGGPGYGYGGPGYGYGGPGYGGPGYGYGGPGYGYGGPGYGYGAPGYGYGAPGYGYGAPGYGYGAPGYGYGAPTGTVVVPQAGSGGSQSEIEALKQRLNQLEQGEIR
jgi:hypothetical protein